MINNIWFKLVGIGAILYFALFHDTSNKQNLRNRLSPDRVKKNISYIKDKAVYAKKNIDKSKNTIDLGATIEKEMTKSDKPYQNLLIGSGARVACGDFAVVNFIKLGNGNASANNNYDLKIDNLELSKNLIGMRVGGKRRVFVNQKVNNKDVEFIYDVKLIKIKNIQENDQKCN